eukprot:6172216-Pleurochrysis_carterae.AAC.1
MRQGTCSGIFVTTSSTSLVLTQYFVVERSKDVGAIQTPSSADVPASASRTACQTSERRRRYGSSLSVLIGSAGMRIASQDNTPTAPGGRLLSALRTSRCERSSCQRQLQLRGSTTPVASQSAEARQNNSG